MWKQVKVSYDGTDPKSGKPKTVNEPFLVDAHSATEAEARTVAKMQELLTGEFTIGDITTKRVDYLPEWAGEWLWEAKVSFVQVNSNGTERHTNHTHILWADNIDGALAHIKESLKEYMVDWEIESIKRSPLADVIVYEAPEEPQTDTPQTED